MKQDRPTQPSLFDYQDRLEYLKSRPKGLDHLNEVVDWEAFRAELEKAVIPEPHGPGGRPRFDAVFMFKILVLQRTYSLSDAETEFQIYDRYSFQRFLGITVSNAIPDEKTVWVFKERLRTTGCMDRCFAAFWAYLEEQGVRTSPGKIVDATFVDVPRQRNPPEENQEIKQGSTPKAWKQDPPARLRQKDVDARWARKGNERHFGYKNHIKIDGRTKLIETYAITPAHVHDSRMLPHLVRDGDGCLYADSAYTGAASEQTLQEHGIADRTIVPRRRNTPLTRQQEAWNRARRRIRARVEHVFGFMTNSMRTLVVRGVGLARVAATMTLANLVYNMHRLAQIQRA